MIRPTTYILTAIAAILFAACSVEDDFGGSNGNKGKTIRIEVPVSIVTGDDIGTRLGDPGVDTECPPPKHVYVMAWVKTGKNEADEFTYAFTYMHSGDLTATDWTLLDKTSGYDARYELNSHILLNLTTPADNVFAKNEMIGRSFAFATSDALDTETIKNIVNGLCTGFNFNGTDETYTVEPITHAQGSLIDANLKNVELTCATWTTARLRDLYSTPSVDDGKVDILGIKNGQILYNSEDYKDEGIVVLHGDVRLYHVAAKYDFKWEVATAIQSTTAIEKITVKDLPTTCYLFHPAKNSALATKNNYIIGGTAADVASTINNGVVQSINPGNKWIGRESFYALQTVDGSFTYTVDFEDMDGTGPGTARPSITKSFTPVDKNDIFTGWYRINATVK